MWFLDARLGDRRVDLRVEAGRIAAVEPAGRGRPAPGEPVRRGGWLCPPFAEPHLHLDAALTGRGGEDRAGTLAEGIARWARTRERMADADLRARALATVRMAVRHGVLRLRTHVDTERPESAAALLELADELRSGVPGLATEDGGAVPVELQVVAFPQEGVLTRPGRRERWLRALDMGCHAVGGAPHLERTEAEGREAVRLAFEEADRRGIPVDLHCDETDDPASRSALDAAAEALDRGMAGRVVLGHCTAMHSWPGPRVERGAALLADAGVQVVVNPLDNAVLQGRHDAYPRRRGLAPVDRLRAAGVPVGIGHDSVQDPWYPLGTGNPLDAAFVLVHLAPLTRAPDLAWAVEVLAGDNHRPFGGPPRLAPGEPATFLWFDADGPVDVLRRRPRPLVVVEGRALRPPEEDA